MLISKLKKYCLQYLEQSDEQNIDYMTMTEIEDDDTYKEYALNINHSIYMGLTRFANSLILPLCEVEITKTPFILTRNGNRIFHKIKEVYAIDSNGNVANNVSYRVIANKIFINNMNSNYKYYVLYHPTINDLSTYKENIDEIDLCDIDGNGLCVPDEMAINIKYLVYSDMKLDENSTVAIYNKNFFEQYLETCKANQIQNNQIEVITRDWGDVMSDEYYGNTNNALDIVVDSEV